MERHRPAPVEGLLTVLERAVDLHGHLDIALPGAGIDAARRADIGVIVLVLAERRRERVGVHPRSLAAPAPELPRLAIPAPLAHRITAFDHAGRPLRPAARPARTTCARPCPSRRPPHPS